MRALIIVSRAKQSDRIAFDIITPRRGVVWQATRVWAACDRTLTPIVAKNRCALISLQLPHSTVIVFHTRLELADLIRIFSRSKRPSPRPKGN